MSRQQTAPKSPGLTVRGRRKLAPIEDGSPSSSSVRSGIRRGDRLIGVFIGIDLYQKAENLTFAANDAGSLCRAVGRAHRGESRLRLLTASRDGRDNEVYPSMRAIKDALREAAATARQGDAVMVFFAGHGCLVEGRLYLLPADGETGREASMLAVREIQDLFQACEAGDRLLFLDCCQNPVVGRESSGGAPAPVSPSSSAHPRIPWRTGEALTTACVEALEDESRGWAVLTACSPGEVSRETHQDPTGRALTENHGLFSQFLAQGLLGGADLDQDGVVSFAELVQYVSAAVPARVAAVEAVEKGSYGYVQPHGRSQHPFVIWRGGGQIPMTRVERMRQRRPQRGLLRLWLTCILGDWPYGEVTARDLMRFGLAVIYGALIATEVLIFSTRVGERWWLMAALSGVVSAAVWLAGSALSVAANRQRWFGGGYLAAASVGLWSGLLFLLLLHELAGTGAGQPSMLLGVDLFVDLVLIAGVMVALGFIPLHLILTLWDCWEERRDLVLRRFFTSLEKGRYLETRLLGSIPTIAVSPRVYIRYFAILGNLALLLHSVVLLIRLLTTSEVELLTLVFLRNVIVAALLLWQVFWFAAAYRQVEHEYVPQV